MDDLERDLLDYLDCLHPRKLEALAVFLGLPPRTGRRGIHARAMERCASPQGALALLEKLGADEVELLLCWAVRGVQGLVRAERWLQRYTPDPVPAPRWAKARDALQARGLCGPHEGSIDMLPCLRTALAPLARARRMKPMRDAAEGTAPLAFCLAVAVGLCASERPLVRADGEIYAASLKRIDKRLGPFGLAGMDPSAAHVLLSRLGVLLLREQGSTRGLHVDASALEGAFRLDPTSFAERALWQQGTQSVDLWTYARVRFAAAAAAQAGKASVGATLEAIEKARIPGPRSSGRWTPLEAPDPWDVLSSLRTLWIAGLVELLPDGNELRFRPRVGAALGTGRAVVQPSFEVLVPWDAAPLAVARLGLYADLEQMDRVCRYRLTPASVRRGSEHLGSGPEIVAHLEQLAGGPVPQNVRVTVEGWAGTQPAVRALQGEVLLAAPEQVEALRRVGPPLREVAPGVLLLPAGTLAKTIEAARAAGIPVTSPLRSTEVGTPPGGASVPSPAGPSFASSYLAGATREAPPPKARDMERLERRRFLHDPFARPGWATAVDVEEDEEDDYVDDDDKEDDDDRALWDILLGKGRRTGAPTPPSKPAWFPDADAGEAAPPAARREAAVPTWMPVLPGQLRSLLEAAIEQQGTLRLMFRNSEGRSVDRRIRPLRFKRTPKGELIEALDQQHGGACTLVLERIVAVAQE